VDAESLHGAGGQPDAPAAPVGLGSPRETFPPVRARVRFVTGVHERAKMELMKASRPERTSPKI
jgi:hypothetical protein